MMKIPLIKNLLPKVGTFQAIPNGGTLESYLIVNRYNYDQTNTGNKIALSMTSNTGWNPSEIQGSPGYDQSIGNKSGFNALPMDLKIH